MSEAAINRHERSEIAAELSPTSALYRWYALALLAVIAGLGTIDRQLPFLLAEPIKRDLALSDGELGVIGGAAFAVFHTVFILPIARLADRCSYKWVITCSVAGWSLLTAVTGLVRSFAELFAARAGVGLGEAGSAAPSHSIIAAYFPPHQRATALSILTLGTTFGVLIGYGLGGWLSDSAGWRTVYFSFGLLGLLVALLAAMTLREPLRTPRSAMASESFDSTLLHVLTRPTLRWLTVGASLHVLASSGITAWLVPFMMRSHGFTTTEAGLAIGLAGGIAGGLGVLIGGLLADQLSKRDVRWILWMPAVSMLVNVPLYFVSFMAETPALFLAWLLPGLIASTSYAGPTFAAVQNLARPSQRATLAALVVLVMNLLGGASGPAIAGYISDYFYPALGSSALQIAIAAVLFVNLPAAACYLLAASTYQHDINASDSR